MKETISALALAAALCAFGEEKTEPAETPASAKEPVPAAQPSAAAARDTVDVIDLEEADDSAEARANAPVVTAAAQEGGATLVDIACDNATLEDVLRQFRKVTDANIISDDSTNLQRRVSVNLHRVPWLDGLQSILNSRNYRLEERGSIFFVKEDKVAEPILTRSFTLNHASAKELADLFNKSYGKKDPKGMVVMPIATSFDAANVVVVTSTEKTIGECESIIKAVDKAVPQIYIEARFLELSSDAMHKLGLDWSVLEDFGVNADVSAHMGREVDKTTTATKNRSTSQSESGNSSSSTGTGGSSSWSLSGIGSSDKSHNSTRTANTSHGFSGTLSVDQFRLAMSAFEQLKEIKIFSNPKVIVSNGKEAKVDMTTKFPNVSLESQENKDTSYLSFRYSARLEQIPGDLNKGMFAGSCFFEWGITLSVTPRISPDGLISVEITPTISQLDYDTSEDDSGFYSVKSSSSVGYFPIISMKSITTDFTMKDGSTAVIGGLSRTEEEDVDSGIPYLRELPWIGPKLFGWKSRQKVQKEIIVCVTIGIANPAELPKDMGLPKNAILGREYVEGRKLEPGDREGPSHEALKLDFRSLEEQKRAETTPGTVTITPAR